MASSIFMKCRYSILVVSVLVGFLAQANEEDANSSATRDLILALAQDGSPESYALFEEILTDPVEVQKIYAGFDGGRLGVQQIDRALYLIGNRQDQESFDLLVRLVNDPVARGSIYPPLLENLLKYQDTHAEEILDVFQERLFFPKSEIDQLIEQYTFVADPSVTREAGGNYRDQDGESIRRSSVFSLDIGHQRAVRGLYLIDTPRSWSMLERFLDTYPGLESVSTLQLTAKDLRVDRYRAEVIRVYEIVAKNEMRSLRDRAVTIASFFDNVTRSTFSQELPQIADAPEESLLRILDFANYALTLDFLPDQQRALGYSQDPRPILDIIYEKRLETIQRLEALGYDPEWLRSPGLKAFSTREEASSGNASESETSDGALAVETDALALPKPVGQLQPTTTGQPARSFPWVSIVLGVGAAGLLVFFLYGRSGKARP